MERLRKTTQVEHVATLSTPKERPYEPIAGAARGMERAALAVRGMRRVAPHVAAAPNARGKGRGVEYGAEDARERIRGIEHVS